MKSPKTVALAAGLAISALPQIHPPHQQIQDPMTPEPFVSAQKAADFLDVSRRYVLSLARKGISGAYPLGTGIQRKIWVFRLSELAAAIAGRTRL